MARRHRLILVLFLLVLVVLFSGYDYSVSYNTEKKVLIAYPVIDNTTSEVIDYYVNYLEDSMSRLEYRICSRHYLDLELEKDSLKRGNDISKEKIINAAKKVGADIVILTKINKYKAHKTVKPGMAVVEPYTLNSQVIDTVSIETEFIDPKNGNTVFNSKREKSQKNRFFGLFISKKYLLHKTLRDCLGETLYLAKKEEVI